MSVSVGRAKLKNAMLDLMAKWEETKEAWQDVRAQKIERDVIDELEPQVRSALSAMDRMASQIAQAERDCS